VILRGSSVSWGAFVGAAHVLDSRAWLAAAAKVPAKQGAARELERLSAARARAAAQLERVQEQLVRRGRRGDSGIFAAHEAMLMDRAFAQRIERAVADEGLSAEAAVARAASALHDELESSGVPMVRDKAADVLDVGRRLARCLDPRIESDALSEAPTVIVTTTLLPSELVRLVHRGPIAALVETCGPRSHVAILARALGIPLVSGISPASVPDGSEVFLDADEGLAVVAPTGTEQELARRIRAKLDAAAAGETQAIGQPTTRDGVPVAVALNISDPLEAEAVPELGAAGVGLYRTEFLYMDRPGWPSEAESLESFEQVARAVGAGELQIRLADFGADKRPDYSDIPTGRNPSLGVRGVRLLLQRDDILGPQVRALAALARFRPVTVLVPMLDGLDTLLRLEERLRRLCRAEGELPFGIGAMVEIPAAALTIDEILARVDCVSIGLNDLTQYLMAADREDELVERYHDALQPAVLRLVRQVVEAADRVGKPVSVCGELAGDPALTTVLLALGVRRFSVSRPDYLRVVTAIRRHSIAELAPLREELMRCGSGAQVRRLLSEHLAGDPRENPGSVRVPASPGRAW